MTFWAHIIHPLRESVVIITQNVAGHGLDKLDCVEEKRRFSFFCPSLLFERYKTVGVTSHTR